MGEEVSASRFRDCVVSVDCGNEGSYQGEVSKLDTKAGEIVLVKVTRNGTPIGSSRVKISSSKIKDMKVYRKVAKCHVPTSVSTSTSIQNPKNGSKTSDPSEFLGCLVSIDCGKEGYYQGLVDELDVKGMAVTLKVPIKDGIPLKTKKLTLFGENIVNLKVVKMPESSSAPQSKTPANAQASASASGGRPALKLLLRRDGGKTGNVTGGHKKDTKEFRKQLINTNEKSPVRGNPHRHEEGPTGIPLLDMANSQKSQKTSSESRDAVDSATSLGPSGIPSVDSANGYTSRHPGGGMLEAPLDHALMKNDFDFDVNLSKFKKLGVSDDGEEASGGSETLSS